ncbi:MAG: cell wall hydrolase [Clostridium sp.]|nr:cell wall hydrolase [Clostridium sp.]
MKKLLITAVTAISLTLAQPVAAQASEFNPEAYQAAQELLSHYKNLFRTAAGISTKYANRQGAEIRREPSEESEILDQTLLNTTFEVVGEENGWSTITTENGRAYIKTESLSSVPTIVRAYSDQDLYILAHVICGEAQNCPDDEQLYVGSVVLNRVSHPSFPNSINGVVFQPGQYACTKDGNYYREPTPQNWANARFLLENGSVLPGHVIWQSGGRQGKGVYLQTKYHSYCY